MQAQEGKGRRGRLRNVKRSDTSVGKVRVVRFKAVLPLGPGHGQHVIGSFDAEEVRCLGFHNRVASHAFAERGATHLLREPANP